MRRKIRSKLAELRVNSGLTQAQLAVFIGVSSNTIQNWEKEDGLAGLVKYMKLCEILNCELSDLVEFVPVPEVEEQKQQKPKSFSIEELRKLRENWGIDKKSPAPDSQSDSKETKPYKS